MIEKITYNLTRNDKEPNIAFLIKLCNTKDLEGLGKLYGEGSSKW